MKRDYVLTYSGRMVSASGEAQDSVPSESDIAISLSRQPRFAGMARRWWSVLDHSLYVAELAIMDGEGPRVVVAALLHDAHEFTGDIPTPFKTPEQREMQQRMDQQIFAAYMPGYMRYLDAKNLAPVVKALDHRALLAEAYVVGPPALTTVSAVVEHFGEAPRDRDIALLQNGLRGRTLGVYPSQLALGAEALNVVKFLKMLDAFRDLANNPLYGLDPHLRQQ